jgi:hypothetical protein
MKSFFAHGKLCKDEMMDVIQSCWKAYDKLQNKPDGSPVKLV